MLVAGAGGFAKELLGIILQNNPNEKLVFFDNFNLNGPDILYNKYRILKSEDEAYEYILKTDSRFALGVANPLLRRKMNDLFQKLKGNLTSIFSPFAYIGNLENTIGIGTNILNNVVIEANNNIGMGCLIHNAAFVSHETSIGNFCEISPSVNILGNVQIGDYCCVGTGSVLLPKIKLGNNVIVGAGSVITKDVPSNSVIVGVPGVVIKKLSPLL